MEDEYRRLEDLYWIANGGLGQYLAERARKEIKRMGYDYPRRPEVREYQQEPRK